MTAYQIQTKNGNFYTISYNSHWQWNSPEGALQILGLVSEKTWAARWSKEDFALLVATNEIVLPHSRDSLKSDTLEGRVLVASNDPWVFGLLKYGARSYLPGTSLIRSATQIPSVR